MKIKVIYKCNTCKQFFKLIRHLPEHKSPSKIEACIMKGCDGDGNYQYHDSMEVK